MSYLPSMQGSTRKPGGKRCLKINDNINILEFWGACFAKIRSIFSIKHRETSTVVFNIFLFAGSASHFAATVGLGVTDIQASDADEAVAAFREGRTRVLGKRTHPKFFIGNTVQSICVIVKRGVQRRKRV